MRARPRTGVLGGIASMAVAALVAFALSSGAFGASEQLPAIPTAQPVIGAPSDTTLIGSSAAEATGETWGYSISSGFSLVRYTETSGTWRAFPAPLDSQGRPLDGFTPVAGRLAGRTTPDGGVVIVGQDAAKVGQVLVRNPGGELRQAPTLLAKASPAGEPAEPNALLEPGETLSASSGEGVLVAPVDQPNGHTGVFLVPSEGNPSGLQEGVLFYDGNGTQWTREPICDGVEATPCKAPASGFKVLGIDASSPTNAWLLAKSGSGAEGIVLFSRNTSGPSPVWQRRSLGGSPFAQASPSFENASVHVAALSSGQPLTVTSQGVWVDGQLAVTPSGQPQQTSGFTFFYRPAPSGTGGEVAASWCNVPAALASLCNHPLEYELPSGDYRSFAWSEGGPYGERVITGFDDGVSLSLRGEAFARVLGAGGESGTGAGAAFSSPEEGWLANRQGGPLTHLTVRPSPSRVQSWPVPFRRPLTAIAEQPGAQGGELGAQAIAVGEDGQVARYLPGHGWAPEALLSASGLPETPNLRGVAWPEAGRAYAVGTKAAMWLWRAETGLWEPDPARPPNLALANFTGIAFNPSDPAQGYAIGQQGVLLGFGKTWTQEPLPAGLEQADFTSIAFAGGEALVTYQIPHFDPAEGNYSGGLLVNDGSGWKVDAGAAAALGHSGVPARVAGLPDGAAAMAGQEGQVFERPDASSAWQPAPAGPVDSYPVALAAFREGAALRVAVSVDETRGGREGSGPGDFAVDRALEGGTPPGQAPIATAAYPLPVGGFLLRETPNGWEDEQHEDYPVPNNGHALPVGETGFDWPSQPDAILALALAPDASQGWAVGGQTGELNRGLTAEHREVIQTAGVMRYPASGTAPTGFAPSPTSTVAGNATFAIGGNAQCSTACADLAQDRLAPDAWLTNAIEEAGQTPGVRAFIYTGAHLAPGLASTGQASVQREADRYAELLSVAGGPPAVFAAPSESDLDQGGTLASFSSAFQGLLEPEGAIPPPPATGITPVPKTSSNSAYFSFDSTGSSATGKVRVIVLDYSRPSLGAAQECWLAGQLAAGAAAGVPAIVVGSRSLSATDESPNLASDAAQVIPILVNGAPPAGEECARKIKEAGLTPGSASAPAGASAYFYDSPQQNRQVSLSVGGASIPAFGNGTLGYVHSPPQLTTQFLGASGFLLAEVEVAKRNATTNRAPVTVRLIPDISDLALDSTNGLLLRRSQAALFTGLARRPHAGLLCESEGPSCNFQPDPYVPIPSTCTGAPCATGILPAYTFTSSNPDIGNFVEVDPASSEGTTVLQNARGEPIPAEPRNSSGELIPGERYAENGKGEPMNERGEAISRVGSGLFCAYNAGTTTVTVKAGGLSSSEQITVQGGSVEQPCGTAKLRHPPTLAQQASLPVPLPAPAPAPPPTPGGTLSPPAAPPVPTPAVPIVPHPIKPKPAASTTYPFVYVPAQLIPLLAVVPPPPPATARPTPPSGTSPVPAQSPITQPVGVAEHEDEHQHAVEHVQHFAAYQPEARSRSTLAAYSHPEQGPMPAWPLGLVLILVAAGVAFRPNGRETKHVYVHE